MRKGAIFLTVLCACNSLLGISDVPEHECQTSADCTHSQHRMECGQHGFCVVPRRWVENANPEIGATIRTEPRIADETVVRSELNGTPLGIVCQTKYGEQAEGRTEFDIHHQPTTIPFTTWDRTDEGYWIYDWYTNSLQVTNGYSPDIDHCPGG